MTYRSVIAHHIIQQTQKEQATIASLHYLWMKLLRFFEYLQMSLFSLPLASYLTDGISDYCWLLKPPGNLLMNSDKSTLLS